MFFNESDTVKTGTNLVEINPNMQPVYSFNYSPKTISYI